MDILRFASYMNNAEQIRGDPFDSSRPFGGTRSGGFENREEKPAVYEDLRDKDSNLDKQLQRLSCYHYTIPQFFGPANRHTLIKPQIRGSFQWLGAKMALLLVFYDKPDFRI